MDGAPVIEHASVEVIEQAYQLLNTYWNCFLNVPHNSFQDSEKLGILLVKEQFLERNELLILSYKVEYTLKLFVNVINYIINGCFQFNKKYM